LGRFAADLITQQHPVAHRTLEADALSKPTRSPEFFAVALATGLFASSLKGGL
jgi:hypothetical protein